MEVSGKNYNSIDNAFQSKLAYSEVTEIYGLQMLEKYEVGLDANRS